MGQRTNSKRTPRKEGRMNKKLTKTEEEEFHKEGTTTIILEHRGRSNLQGALAPSLQLKGALPYYIATFEDPGSSGTGKTQST